MGFRKSYRVLGRPGLIKGRAECGPLHVRRVQDGKERRERAFVSVLKGGNPRSSRVSGAKPEEKHVPGNNLRKENGWGGKGFFSRGGRVLRTPG